MRHALFRCLCEQRSPAGAGPAGDRCSRLPQAANEDVFQLLLLAGAGLRIDVVLLGLFGDLLERELAAQDVLVLRLRPTGITLVGDLLQRAVFPHLCSDEEGMGAKIGTTDVRVEQIFGPDGLTTDLGVEVHATYTETAAADHVIHAESHRVDIVGELIGVPAEKRIAAIDVERTKDAEVGSRGDLMLKAVARKQGVVGLEIELYLVLQAVLLEEPEYRCGVEVVLMRGGLLWLGFDEDLTLEADLVLVVDDEVEHAGELLELLLHVGVQQGLVAFAATPEHVVGAAKLDSDVHAVLDGGGGPDEDFRVRVGGGTGHEARVREEVRRAPEQLRRGRLLLRLQVVGDG